MSYAFRGILAWGFFILNLFSYSLHAEETSPPPFSEGMIAQMVAPIALYPDPLLSQILMASTYPLEVVSAARWLQANPDLKGEALQDALSQQNWDPSVKSLTEFPNVLNMMNEKLDMTTNLGNAFLDQQTDVLDAIQKLRAKAKAAGYLNSGDEQVIDASSADITITPSDPNTIYVPIYDPSIVYGSWDYPDDPPYFYYPSGYTLGPAAGFAFATGLLVGDALWGNINWKDDSLGIDPARYNAFNHANITDGRWFHDSAHREGVPYRSVETTKKYGQSQRQAQEIKSREDFRGHSEEFLEVGQRQDFSKKSTAVDRVQSLSEQNFDEQREGLNRGEEARLNPFEGLHEGEQSRQFSDRGAASLGGEEFHGGGGFHGGGRR